MNRNDRDKIHLAGVIHDQLVAMHQRQILGWPDHLNCLAERMRQLLQVCRKLTLCQIHHKQSPISRLQVTAMQQLPDIAYEIEHVQRIQKQRQPALPSLRDLVSDLQQLRDEFDGYQYDRKCQLLSVTTEPIELQNIGLGPFEIQLRLPSLACPGSAEVYTIEALEPNPAASDNEVTHPHISHGRLCEGDAAAPIRMAIAGRPYLRLLPAGPFGTADLQPPQPVRVPR